MSNNYDMLPSAIPMKDLQLQTRLRKALQTQKLEKVHHALAEGAHPNWYVPGQGGLTPMQEAAAKGFIPGLEALLAAGGSVDFPGEDKSTPLLTAASKGQVDAGRWLLRHEANARAITLKYDEDALMKALSAGHLAFADMLLAERPWHQHQPLKDVACRLTASLNVNVVRWLLDHDASPDTKNLAGSPWLFCVLMGKAELRYPLVQMLLDAGADVNAQTLHGKTPLHRAVELNCPKEVLLLLRAGADPDIPNSEGLTVRSMIENLSHATMEVYKVFHAWEASRVASCAIEAPISGMKPL